MSIREQRVLIATFVLAIIQVQSTRGQSPLAQPLRSASVSAATRDLPPESHEPSLRLSPSDVSLPPQSLFDLENPDIKFRVESLMNLLRDSKHESWVLAAYPDPKTSQPLIGAGFNLAVPATEHLQSNPLNPYPFIELSSAQAWQAAGLDLVRLQNILAQFDRDLKTWKKDKFRRKIRAHQLVPEITEEEATRLLRISALQAIHNSRAYCDDFDQLTASQQMALSQLVFQMGVNLEEFVQFLGVINDRSVGVSLMQAGIGAPEDDYWKTVQLTLIQSEWARRYTSRAITVIAMFDPDYDREPQKAEQQVQVYLHPQPPHHHRRAHLNSVRASTPATP
jgi:hypothetical protein